MSDSSNPVTINGYAANVTVDPNTGNTTLVFPYIGTTSGPFTIEITTVALARSTLEEIASEILTLAGYPPQGG